MEKKIISVLTGLILILAITLMSSTTAIKGEGIPPEVDKILENSCYGCHTTGAKSEDALKAVNFSKWDDLKATKKVGALNEIKEVIEEGAMPPKKVLKKYPKMTLSEDDKKTIFNWVDKETANLMK